MIKCIVHSNWILRIYWIYNQQTCQQLYPSRPLSGREGAQKYTVNLLHVKKLWAHSYVFKWCFWQLMSVDSPNLHFFLFSFKFPLWFRAYKADCVSFGTMRSGMLLLTFSRTVPTAIFTIPPRSNCSLPWHSWDPQRTRFLPLQTGCGKFSFFIWLYLCPTQHYTRHVHGQRVICSHL